MTYFNRQAYGGLGKIRRAKVEYYILANSCEREKPRKVSGYVGVMLIKQKSD